MEVGGRLAALGHARMGHGSLVGWVVLATLGPPEDAAPTCVRSRTFDVYYAVNESALPLDSVRLWFTHDEGASWQEYSPDEDRQSPIAFQAPDEGEFGFFLVMSNATGASSDPPESGTPSQQRAFVDFTPPVVQLHPIRVSSSLGQATIQVRWTAIDAHLTARPIELLFRQLPDETWSPAGPEPLANTGRFDWRIPEGVSGAIAVRIVVSDRGGHRVSSDPQSIDTSSPEIEPSQAVAEKASPMHGVETIETTALPGSKRAKEKVSRLVDEAAALRQRGDLVAGVSRLRDAIRLDPKRTDAFTEMAGMLLRLNEPEKALQAYEIVLQQRPNDRDALRGAARVFKERRDGARAAERLRKILRYNPRDAEVWMELGDLAVFQGDEVLARDCYTRATTIDPNAATVIAEARERLAMLASTSQR